jgi:hypothetical protein
MLSFLIAYGIVALGMALVSFVADVGKYPLFQNFFGSILYGVLWLPLMIRDLIR